MPDGAANPTVHGAYQAEITADIASCLQTMGCQPILFIGSGLSKRYFGGPSWDELLGYLAKYCPLIDRDYAYYKQSLGSPLATGEAFANKYQEWAWSSGRSRFPENLFNERVPANAYIKHTVAEWLSALTPASLASMSESKLVREIAARQAIRPTPFRVTRFCPALGHGGRISGGRVSLAGCFGAARAERVGERDGPNGLGARVSARLG